jgi:2-polyprenyl-3-methyl-5-hydroxy-6-metoxy-1,4-benzoquinol methylase
MRSASEINRAVWEQAAASSRVLAESRLRRVGEILERQRPGALLDIACGPALLSGTLPRHGWQVFGVEQVEALARAAHQRIAVVCADVGTSGLPFAAHTFDVVFAGEIIEHIVDTDGLLGEIQRVLRRGGMAIVTTPNLASFENRVRLLLGRYPRWLEFRAGGEGHVRAYTVETLRHQLTDHGFTVRAVTGNWIPFLPQRLVDDVRQPWLAATGRWFPTLAMDIIVVAEKMQP